MMRTIALYEDANERVLELCETRMVRESGYGGGGGGGKGAVTANVS